MAKNDNSLWIGGAIAIAIFALMWVVGTDGRAAPEKRRSFCESLYNDGITNLSDYSHESITGPQVRDDFIQKCIWDSE